MYHSDLLSGAGFPVAGVRVLWVGMVVGEGGAGDGNDGGERDDGQQGVLDKVLQF